MSALTAAARWPGHSPNGAFGVTAVTKDAYTGSSVREVAVMAQYRFNVFGQLVVITGTRGNWAAFLLGTDGERRKADFIVPGSSVRG